MREQENKMQPVKKLLRAGDPDFTKATADDLEAHRVAMEEYANGETVAHDAVNWD